jgi:hypothetical protein
MCQVVVIGQYKYMRTLAHCLLVGLASAAAAAAAAAALPTK